MVDALAVRDEEGRTNLRKASVSWYEALITVDIRMGKPDVFNTSFLTESNRLKKSTKGTETSKYLEEKKSIEIPWVVASEMGKA